MSDNSNSDNEVGDVYTWGIGEMNQLGYSAEEIMELNRDKEDFPYQPLPKEIKTLKHKQISGIAAGKGYCMALTTKGQVYAWGGGACGQLGLDIPIKDLPRDADNFPCEPTPTLIKPLKDLHVFQYN